MSNLLNLAIPGDIFLARIEGPVGKLVWLGQAINGDLSKWTHAGIVVSDHEVFEAQPGGAVLSDFARYDGREIAVLHRPGVSDFQRAKMVKTARGLVGSPYNWSTYFYLAAYRMRLPLLTRLFRKRVEKPDRMICSQAVDYLCHQAGDLLFDDGRLPYDVTPGDLAKLTGPETIWEGEPS